MNIVFDLGGVVFNWQPDKIVKNVFSDVGTQHLVKAEIFNHPDWIELDRGTLDLERAIDRGASRTQLPRSDIIELMNQVPQFLTPINETIDFIKSIRDTENKLFVLSNMHFTSIAHLERTYSFLDMFDGMVISCRIQKVKPEIEIYQNLLIEYGLIAEETIFIDDMDINLEAASSMGIKTIKFVDSAQCRQDLSTFKCI